MITRDNHTLVVDFDASVAHRLAGKLRIHLRVEILDAAASLVRVEAAGVLSQHDMEIPNSWKVLHQGLSSGGDISLAVERCMYLAMDYAQQRDGQSGCEDLELGRPPLHREVRHLQVVEIVV